MTEKSTEKANEKTGEKKAERSPLDDEMIPYGGKSTTPPSHEGETRDTAGKHGKMAPESARGIEPEDES